MENFIKTFKTLILLMFVFCFSFLLFENKVEVKAKTEEVSISIYKNNVSYSGELYFLYAINTENIDITNNTVELLFWESEQVEYVKGTEKYSKTKKALETIDGEEYLVFYSNGISAKNIVDDIYTRAYVKIGEIEYYSEVNVSSIVEYIYRMKKSETLSSELNNLFDALLNYGAAAQLNFNYKTDKLANDIYKEINVIDGTINNKVYDYIYKQDEVSIIALDKTSEGLLFLNWTDSNNNIVSYDREYTFNVLDNETYKANYIESSKVVSELNFSYEIPYQGSVENLDLPQGIIVEREGKEIVLEIECNTSELVADQIGEQTIYATLVDENAYELFGVGKEDITITLNVLPYTMTLDTETNTYTITGYYGTEQSLEIPSKVNDIKVTSIDDHAFYGCESITSIEISEGIENIGAYAMFGCNSLISITLPFIGSTIEDSGFRYFGYIFGATTIFTSNEYIPSTLKEITINGGTIGENAFVGCASVEKITLLEDIVSIHSTSFEACSIGMEVYFKGNNNAFEEKINEEFKNSKEYFLCEFYILDENKEYYLYNSFEEFVYDLISLDECIDLLLEDLSDYYGVEANKDNIESISEEHSKKMYDFFLTDEKYSKLWSWLGDYFVQTRMNDDNKSAGYTYLLENNNAYWRYEVKGFVNQTAVIGWPYSSNYSLDTNKKNFEKELYLAELSGHYTINNVEKEATCDEEGIICVSCARCDYSTYEVINALGHDEVEHEAKEATCTEVGNEAYVTCSRCDYTTYVEIPASHDEVEHEGKAATCTESGHKAYVTCTRCDYSTYEEIEALGHKYSNEWTIDQEATETSIGTKSHHCMNEGCESKIDITEIPMLPYSDGLTYELNENEDGYTVSGIGECTDSDIKIPQTYNGLPVVEIKSYSFNRCTSLTSIEIPNSVTSIEDMAFYRCISLQSIIVEEGNSVYDSRENCNAIIETSTNKLILGCQNTTIPTSVTSIGNSAFFGYTSLTSIEIPSSVTSIGDYAFRGCASLTSIEIPTSVTSIGDYAFAFCYDLTSIEIPNSVTSIGVGVFDSCTSLTSIEIPNSVTSIGFMVFNGCTSLGSIYFNGTSEEWENVEKNNLLDYYSGDLYIKDDNGEYQLYTN